MLLVGSSRNAAIALERRIRWLAAAVAGAGLLFGLLLSWWAARVTRPVQELVKGAREVAGGNWSARVTVRGKDEIGQLAQSVQSDDAAVDGAARTAGAGGTRGGMARTGAAAGARAEESALPAADHGRESASARKEQNPEQFDEVFRESTGILLAEIET